MIKRLKPSFDPLRSKNTQTIKRLISNCLNEHVDCRSRKQFLPTWLIDVRTDNESGYVRSIAVEKLSLSTAYAALSHVWGDTSIQGAFPITTSATIRSREDHIPVSTMPKNPRDAVEEVRALGI
jgi:hypothetical protein